ncbi:MAG: FAD-dependent oxidoreductase [Planctomycetota bacterium]|nr:FAD-dependent oxidoreductase [Planctomycetota bacterium]
MPSPHSPERFAIIVIGAGSTGRLAAHQLLEAGVGPIALLDRFSTIQDIDSSTIGLLAPGTHQLPIRLVHSLGEQRSRQIWEVTRAALPPLRNWISQLNIPSDDGGWSFHSNHPAERAEIENSTKLWEKWGHTPIFIPSTHPLGEGFHLPGPVQFSTDSWPFASIRSLRSRGVHVRWSSGVVSLGSQADGTQEVITSSGTLLSEFVYLATGWNTPQLVPSLSDHIYPVRLQTLRTSPLAHRWTGHHSVRFGHDHFQQKPCGRFLIRGMRWAAQPDMGCGKTQKKIHPAIHKHQLDAVQSLFPGETVVTESVTSSIETFTSDDLPIIGPWPGNPRRFIACGFSGHGLLLGMVAAQQIAQSISGQTRSTPPLTDLRPARFL